MRFQLIRTAFRQRWRWVLRAANGRLLATSGEAFHNRADCLANIDLVRSATNAGTPVVERSSGRQVA